MHLEAFVCDFLTRRCTYILNTKKRARSYLARFYRYVCLGLVEKVIGANGNETTP